MIMLSPFCCRAPVLHRPARTEPPSASAAGVGTMPSAVRTKRRSWKCSRRRRSPLLTAGCDSPTASAARDTLRWRRTASNTTSRFRSSWRLFIRMMLSILHHAFTNSGPAPVIAQVRARLARQEESPDERPRERCPAVRLAGDRPEPGAVSRLHRSCALPRGARAVLLPRPLVLRWPRGRDCRPGRLQAHLDRRALGRSWCATPTARSASSRTAARTAACASAARSTATQGLHLPLSPVELQTSRAICRACPSAAA
jgi:hypothetical protein